MVKAARMNNHPLGNMTGLRDITSLFSICTFQTALKKVTCFSKLLLQIAKIPVRDVCLRVASFPKSTFWKKMGEVLCTCILNYFSFSQMACFIYTKSDFS